MGKNKFIVKDLLYLFTILLAIWLALTLSLKIDELLAGILISLIISFALYKNFQKIGLPLLSIKKIIYIILYILVLLKEIIAANIDVAYRIIHPKLPINPGIVIIKTELKQDLAKMILANSITLTPGTFVLDIDDDKLLVHWINVKTDDLESATQKIGRRFEKYLKIIFS
ncbi:MAG: Na+/H+ antiporter subunit E [Bacteroidales bacterium]